MMRPLKRPSDPRCVGTHRDCIQCGGRFYSRPSEDRKCQGGARRYCSMKCRVLGYRGEGNPKWRGGTYTQGSGYIYEYAPDHLHATADGYVMQHRLVIERSIGRVLDPTEEVHHRNRVRDDNRLENLQLMSNRQEHLAHHADYRVSQCATCGTQVKRSAAHRRRWARAFCGRTCAAAAATAANAAAAKARRA